MEELGQFEPFPARQNPPDHPRVLVVDDDASTRLMAREVLAPAGFVVEEAPGGRQGLLLVDSFRPDVVLLDILMPEMDGFETLKALRNLEHGSGCPVVMITGVEREFEQFIKTRRQVPPPDGYHRKPFDPQEVLETVRAILGERETTTH